MALAILDGTQTATTLSTILSSGQHITAHTVVSLGTQAITDMRSAVSGSVVSILSLPAISGTVTANVFGEDKVSVGAFYPIPLADSGEAVIVDVRGGFNQASVPISGTVTVGNTVNFLSGSDNDANLIENIGAAMSINNIGGITNALPAGTNRIGVVTIGGGTVTIGAGTAQIGSVTASISGTVPISISSVTIGNSLTIGSLPAISGTVTANTFAVQGTAVTTSNFTSTTASTVLASFNATREVLTIFNEGAGNLHICAGATCTTIAYQVRLSSGDFYEVPNHQTTITHSAVFATAGTARVTQVS